MLCDQVAVEPLVCHSRAGTLWPACSVAAYWLAVALSKVEQWRHLFFCNRGDVKAARAGDGGKTSVPRCLENDSKRRVASSSRQLALMAI